MYYTDGERQRWMRVPLESGVSEALPFSRVPGAGVFPLQAISRDGRFLAVFGSLPDPATNTYKHKLAILDTDALSAPPRILEVDPRIVATGEPPRFTPDGLALVYVISSESNVGNLLLQPLNGKQRPSDHPVFLRTDPRLRVARRQETRGRARARGIGRGDAARYVEVSQFSVTSSCLAQKNHADGNDVRVCEVNDRVAVV